MTSVTSRFQGAFSIGSSQRATLETKNDSPGPGAYQSERYNSKTSPKYEFTKSSRQPLFQNKKIPGPSQYNPDINSIKGHIQAFKIPTQVDPLPKESRVGPGTYHNDVSLVKESPSSFTFQSRFEETAKESLKFPGPGQYNLSNLSVRPKVCTFGLGDKNGIYKADNVKYPGVGQYDIKSSQQIAIKFPQSVRESLNQSLSPGPGSFDIARNINPPKGLTIGIKNSSDKSNNYAPGPGSYNVDSFISDNKGITIGKSQRLKMKINNSPSPLEYNIQTLKNSRKIKFPQSTRQDLSINTNIPGPGKYEAKNLFGTGSNAIIPRAKLHTKQALSLVPGPGDYNINESMLSSGPSVIMKNTTKLNKINKQQTGPGSYDIVSHRSQGPQYSFGQEERLKSEISLLYEPGVGRYNLNSEIGMIPNYLKKHHIVGSLQLKE